MPKEIDLQANIMIFPLNDGEMPEGYEEADRGTSVQHKKFDPNAKEIVLVDPVSGETIHYKMTGWLTKKVAGQLKMSNKGLDAMLKKEQEEQRLEALKQQLSAGGNGAMSAEQMEAMQREMRGKGKG